MWHRRTPTARCEAEAPALQVCVLAEGAEDVLRILSHRLRVSDGGDAVVVDLVADPVAVVEPPQTHDWAGTSILVDTPHEMLVNKLCSLLGRAELRHQWDVADLLAAGGDLERALADAPRKDKGFSALTLAWVLKNLAVESLGEVAGMEPGATRRLWTYRDEPVPRLVALARPGA